MTNYNLGVKITQELKEKMLIEADKLGLTLATYVRLLLIQKHN